MRVSSREAILIILTATAVLFGGTALLARSRIEQWKTVLTDKKTAKKAIEMDKMLAAQKGRWQKEYDELSQKLSRFPVDQKMDLHWRSVLNSIAKESRISIVKIDASGDEEQNGEVFELPIECRQWEGDLDSVVHFLLELEKGKDMLDIRQLNIKPKQNSAELRGRFSLYCAYTREGVSN